MTYTFNQIFIKSLDPLPRCWYGIFTYIWAILRVDIPAPWSIWASNPYVNPLNALYIPYKSPLNSSKCPYIPIIDQIPLDPCKSIHTSPIKAIFLPTPPLLHLRPSRRQHAGLRV